MRAEPEVVLVALYVPGDRPDRFAKAAATGADVVILDLEDAVGPAVKDVAREHVAAWVETGPDTPLQVRVNALDTPWARQDLAMLRSLDGRVGVRIPKVESADDVHAVAAAVGDAARLHPMLETARGVEAALDVARADPAVATVGLGEADLASDLGVTGEEALSWARSRLVVAARAAGLPPPMLSVYPQVRDLEGLAASCRAGRALGFVGRTAVHPRQVPVIAAAFQPTPEEVAAATATLRALEQAAEAGTGVLLLPDGRMVDPAMAGHARRVLAIDQAARAHLDRRAAPDA